MERGGRVGGEALAAGHYLRLGVDVEEAFAEHFDLWSAEGGGERRELAVDVGGVDKVGVDKGEVPHPAAYQRLGTPGADPAQAEDDDFGGGEALHRLCTQEEFGAAEKGSCHRRSIYD